MHDFMPINVICFSYWANLKLWFKQKISKEEFDVEARRLLGHDNGEILSCITLIYNHWPLPGTALTLCEDRIYKMKDSYTEDNPHTCTHPTVPISVHGVQQGRSVSEY